MKRVVSILLILFTFLTQTVASAPASANGWVNEPLWREVDYGQSIEGTPYIGETLLYNLGSWPVKAGVTHHWRTGGTLVLTGFTTLSTQLSFTIPEGLAGFDSLSAWTIDTSTPGIVHYSRTRVARITCSPLAPPTIQVTHNPSQPAASLSISGGTNPSISKGVSLPTPFYSPQADSSYYSTAWDKNGEDESSWPNKTFDYFVAKNGQTLYWSVSSRKIVRGWWHTIDCSSFSAYAALEFGVVFKEAPRLLGWSTGTLRLANDNPVWGNQSVQTYQWTNNGVPIPGATSSSYTLKKGEVDINLAVTGSKAGWPSRTILYDPNPRAMQTVPSPAPSTSPISVGQPTTAPSTPPISVGQPTTAPSTPPISVGQPTTAPSTPPISVGQPTTAPKETSPPAKVVEPSIAMKELSTSPKQAGTALIKKLTSKEIQNLDPKVFAQIPASTISAMDSKQAKSVTPAQLLALSSSTLKKVSPKLLATLPPKTLSGLAPSRLATLTASQKKAVTNTQLKLLSPAQRKSIGR